MKPNVILGITGSIAAYKAAEIASQLTKRGVIAIDALLFREPDIAIGSRDGNRISDVIDNIILLDIV